jgi:hypothetical protein
MEIASCKLKSCIMDKYHLSSTGNNRMERGGKNEQDIDENAAG